MNFTGISLTGKQRAACTSCMSIVIFDLLQAELLKKKRKEKEQKAETSVPSTPANGHTGKRPAATPAAQPRHKKKRQKLAQPTK